MRSRPKPQCREVVEGSRALDAPDSRTRSSNCHSRRPEPSQFLTLSRRVSAVRSLRMTLERALHSTHVMLSRVDGEATQDAGIAFACALARSEPMHAPPSRVPSPRYAAQRFRTAAAPPASKKLQVFMRVSWCSRKRGIDATRSCTPSPAAAGEGELAWASSSPSSSASHVSYPQSPREARFSAQDDSRVVVRKPA